MRVRSCASHARPGRPISAEAIIFIPSFTFAETQFHPVNARTFLVGLLSHSQETVCKTARECSAHSPILQSIAVRARWWAERRRVLTRWRRARGLGIEDGVVTGTFPKRALRHVMEWSELHQADLAEDWQLAQERKALKRIAPLE